MTAAVARVATPADSPLLAGYVAHLAPLGLSDRALRDRLRIARQFLGRHPDLQHWMRRPVTERVEQLRRTGAWPLVCYLIGTGQLHLDLELAGAKNLTGLAAMIEARDPTAFGAAREAGRRLGWTPDWINTVLGECLAVILAWHGGAVGQLTTDVINTFDAALNDTNTMPASSRRAYRNRLAGLRQLLFQTHILDAPPRADPPAAPSSSSSLTW